MRKTLTLALCLPLFVSGCSAPRHASNGHASAQRDLNAQFRDPDLNVQTWVDRWESESREIYVSRVEVIAALQLDSGVEVADVGAGTGIFMMPLAEAVGPTGTVYAVDIAPRFVQHIRKRAHDAGLRNVVAILSREDSTRLAPASVDVVLLCDTYHHFDQPEPMLQSIFQALRPGGRFVVIDFERIPGESREWVLGHVRAGKEVFRAEIEAAGFVYVDEVNIDGFRENYLIRFKRP